MKQLVTTAVLISLLTSSVPPMISIDTRPGVTVDVTLTVPDAQPKGIFLLYPGGVGLLSGRAAWVAEAFPRVPQLFAEQGFVAALVDVPSDQLHGYGSGFRISREHAEDANKIIDALSQKWRSPIFLLGHSAGGVSVLHIASALKDRRIGGIVLTASSAGGISRSNVPLEEIAFPVLRVHHRDDNCLSSQAALEQGSRFIKSLRVGFIEVLGGDPSRQGRCGPNNPTPTYAHYFFGKERDVVRAVTDWAIGRSVPRRIDP